MPNFENVTLLWHTPDNSLNFGNLYQNKNQTLKAIKIKVHIVGLV